MVLNEDKGIKRTAIWGSPLKQLWCKYEIKHNFQVNEMENYKYFRLKVPGKLVLYFLQSKGEFNRRTKLRGREPSKIFKTF